jgi:hypothetical protein
MDGKWNRGPAAFAELLEQWNSKRSVLEPSAQAA